MEDTLESKIAALEAKVTDLETRLIEVEKSSNLFETHFHNNPGFGIKIIEEE